MEPINVIETRKYFVNNIEVKDGYWKLVQDLRTLSAEKKDSVEVTIETPAVNQKLTGRITATREAGGWNLAITSCREEKKGTKTELIQEGNNKDYNYDQNYDPTKPKTGEDELSKDDFIYMTAEAARFDIAEMVSGQWVRECAENSRKRFSYGSGVIWRHAEKWGKVGVDIQKKGAESKPTKPFYKEYDRFDKYLRGYTEYYDGKTVHLLKMIVDAGRAKEKEIKHEWGSGAEKRWVSLKTRPYTNAGKAIELQMNFDPVR